MSTSVVCKMPGCSMPARTRTNNCEKVLSYCEAHATKELRLKARSELARNSPCSVVGCDRPRFQRRGDRGRFPMYCDIHIDARARPMCSVSGCRKKIYVANDEDLQHQGNSPVCKTHRDPATYACKRCKAQMETVSSSRVCLACRSLQKSVREQRRRERSLTVTSSPMRASNINQARIIAMKKAGWLPMESFPGLDRPWRCRNLSCKHIELVKFKRRRQHACAQCSGRGRNNAPATVYLIVNHELNALKIGWHKRDSDRMDSWRRRGWLKVVSFDVAVGRIASACEKAILHWWRLDLCLGWAVHPDAMGEMHGASETVPLNLVSVEECISRLAAEVHAFPDLMSEVA